MPYTSEVAHRNVLRSPAFSEQQRKTVKRFDEWIQVRKPGRQLTLSSRVNYLARLKVFVKRFYGHRSLEELTKDDITQYLLQIPSSTSRLDTAMFKVFTTFLERDDLYNCFKTRKHKVKKKQPLTEEEVERLILACRNVFEKAVVTFLFDSGCRLGELTNLKIKDLLFDEYGAKVTLDGKTGERTIRLATCVPALQNFLNHHPHRKNREAWVFYGRNPANRASDGGIRDMIARIGKRAGINRRVHPHLLRHTACTILASHFTNRKLEKRFGWRPGSDMAAVYTSHYEMEEVDNHYLEIVGNKEIIKETPRAKIKAVTCIRCGEPNDGSNEFCGKCGLVLNREKAVEMELEERKARRALALLSNPRVWRFLEKKANE